MPASNPSSPSSAPDATATAQLTVRTADALAEVAVLDGHLNSVASGVGGLVAKLRPGLYQIDVRTGRPCQSTSLGRPTFTETRRNPASMLPTWSPPRTGFGS